MKQDVYDRTFGGNAAENYQRYFVPAIGGPVAQDLIEVAALRPGERVLDIACGTGVVTRLAAERVAPSGSVAGLDINPGMLAVARSETPTSAPVEWFEASAESMPFEDGAFDVALCQMGLQFVPNKLAALREALRVLKDGGRLHANLPGPKPALFGIMSEALGRYIGPEAASFADLVFSLHDADELGDLLHAAGFRDIEVQAENKDLMVPGPRDFLWQYVNSTPMAAAAAQADGDTLEAMERDVCDRWQRFATNGRMALQVGMTTASAVK